MGEELFADHLLDGERVVWSGQAGQGLILTARNAFLIPFSLLWCGFAVFWTIKAMESRAPSFFTLWGTMFICFGLYGVVGRFVPDALIRRDMRIHQSPHPHCPAVTNCPMPS
jgi:uncharacterized membrane protein